ncbi:hypothetical protein Cob_v006908 [Colletotrichum orbiculare MAFF 240422]|uniref:Uncharacterized protein n=1 Tax=Colletotrichum orbiculare (strain 104-T / ATCC 96160 / CBS 514.97 / LARS 414 / MAFF 240422) TaxID=1213857 RepID=A0A484FNX0_COLOR|nr:hypothetical protein Cob_v006908 [Colletotrichum orbiculare MAFF 240422]
MKFPLFLLIANIALCVAAPNQQNAKGSILGRQAGDPNCVTGGGSCDASRDRCCAGGSCLGGVCSTD